jgi:hypothetical protein
VLGVPPPRDGVRVAVPGVAPGVPPPHDGVRLAVLGVVLTLFSRRVILGCVVMLFQLYRGGSAGGSAPPRRGHCLYRITSAVSIDCK